MRGTGHSGQLGEKVSQTRDPSSAGSLKGMCLWSEEKARGAGIRWLKDGQKLGHASSLVLILRATPF